MDVTIAQKKNFLPFFYIIVIRITKHPDEQGTATPKVQ